MSAGIDTEAVRMAGGPDAWEAATRDIRARADAQKPKIVGDPEPNHEPRTYFERDPGMTLQQRRQRLYDLGAAGMTERGLGLRAKQFDESTLDALEPTILDQARAKSRTSGQLFRRVTQDRTGREVITFDGDPRVWMNDFRAPGVRIRINNRAGQHKEGGQWVRDGFHLAEVSNS